MSIKRFLICFSSVLLAQGLLRLLVAICLTICAVCTHADVQIAVQANEVKESVAISGSGLMVLLGLGLLSLVVIRRRKLWLTDTF